MLRVSTLLLLGVFSLGALAVPLGMPSTNMLSNKANKGIYMPMGGSGANPQVVNAVNMNAANGPSRSPSEILDDRAEQAQAANTVGNAGQRAAGNTANGAPGSGNGLVMSMGGSPFAPSFSMVPYMSLGNSGNAAANGMMISVPNTLAPIGNMVTSGPGLRSYGSSRGGAGSGFSTGANGMQGGMPMMSKGAFNMISNVNGMNAGFDANTNANQNGNQNMNAAIMNAIAMNANSMVSNAMSGQTSNAFTDLSSMASANSAISNGNAAADDAMLSAAMDANMNAAANVNAAINANMNAAINAKRNAEANLEDAMRKAAANNANAANAAANMNAVFNNAMMNAAANSAQMNAAANMNSAMNSAITKASMKAAANMNSAINMNAAASGTMNAVVANNAFTNAAINSADGNGLANMNAANMNAALNMNALNANGMFGENINGGNGVSMNMAAAMNSATNANMNSMAGGFQLDDALGRTGAGNMENVVMMPAMSNAAMNGQPGLSANGPMMTTGSGAFGMTGNVGGAGMGSMNGGGLFSGAPGATGMMVGSNGMGAGGKGASNMMLAAALGPDCYIDQAGNIVRLPTQGGVGSITMGSNGGKAGKYAKW